MKTRNLLIVSAVTALATVNLLAADVALSPRASDHQTKIVSGANTDPNLTAANPLPASPRFLDSEVKTVAGKDTTVAPSCAQMNGSPKDIGVCAEHPGASMPCCGGGAAKK
jgi:hypothetical protein